jgi:tryptophan halogenase
LPPTREIMDIVARRYNRKFLRHWDQIIEFLKLHYVLSSRNDSPYWQDNRAAASVPEELAERLLLWRHRSPWHQDAGAVDDLFPTASYQYILYGMGFATEPRRSSSHLQQQRQASELFRKNAARAAQLRQALPGNRELLDKVREFGFQKL